MAADDGGHVTDGPLRARGGEVHATEDQRPERVFRAQRPVRAAAGVRLTAEVGELTAGRGRQQHLTGGRTAKRRPHALQHVGMVGRVEGAVTERGAEDRELPIEAP